MHEIKLQLENTGFVKAKIYLDVEFEGVRLSHDTMTFFSQEGLITSKFLLFVEPLKLIKDKLYSLKVLVQTEYEILTIPVEIKVVFPKKAFYKQLVKYSVLGCILFAAIRFVLGYMTDNNTWFSLQQNSNPPEYSNYLSHNYFSYFIGLVLLIGSMVASIFLIRKIEKV